MPNEDLIAETTESARRQNRRKDTITPVGDLFAPFFDVVFYIPSPEIGRIAALEEEAVALDRDPNTRALAASNRATAKNLRAALASVQSQSQLESTAAIGQGRLNLSSVSGNVSYSPAGGSLANLINFRGNLQVSMVSAAALQATLTLNLPYEAAIQVVDEKLIRFGAIMEVQWGYLASDGRKPAVSDKGLFRITQPSIKFGQSTTVTIGGFDILSGSLTTTDTRCQWPRAAYPCDLDIIRKIVTTRVGSGMALNYSGVGDRSPLRKRKSDEGIVQSDDDWTFFRRILRQNNVSFDVVENTLVLKDEARVNNTTPRYRLLWYKQPEAENDTDIPMISFETNPILSLFAGPRGVRGQRTICRDPETKMIVVVDKDPANTGVTGVGPKNTGTSDKAFSRDVIKTSTGQFGVFADLDSECTSGRYYTQPCQRPNQEEEIERENYELSNFNTKARAVCPGVPGFIPQEICTVHGVGKIFGGNYRVMKVVHNIGAGYTMDIDLLRTAASGATGTGETGKQDGSNTKNVDTSAVSGATVEPVIQERASEDGTGAGCVDEAATAVRQNAANAAAAVKRSVANAVGVSATRAAAAAAQALEDLS